MLKFFKKKDERPKPKEEEGRVTETATTISANENSDAGLPRRSGSAMTSNE